VNVQVTRIHQIEITNECNLACEYCPHSKMQRPKQHMSMETFEQAMNHVSYYDRKGTQPELSLTGMGESFLNPLFMSMCRLARDEYGKRILLSTNGIKVSEEEIKELAELNIELYISLHRPERAKKTIDLAMKYGILADVNASFVTSSLNWAGQIEWEETAPVIECIYLKEGWATVLSNGDITTCCFDYEGYHVSDNVGNEVKNLVINQGKLCDSCSQVIPNDIIDKKVLREEKEKCMN